MAFHPQFGTFATAGSDGTYNFWDKVCLMVMNIRIGHSACRSLLLQAIGSHQPAPLSPPLGLASPAQPCPPQDSKQRLKAQAKCTYGNAAAPIPCGTFNKDGTIYAYAVSYDWSRGYSEYNPSTMKNAILLHPIKEEEVKPKPKAAVGRK